jgi:ribosomal protein S20
MSKVKTTPQNPKSKQIMTNVKAQSSNQIQSSKIKVCIFKFLALICHLDFEIWISKIDFSFKMWS